MAKYGITYSCGHPGSVQIVGPIADRAGKVAWYEQHGICPACKTARHEAERAAANAASRATNAAEGLPALEGSPKQIAWAETIRREQIDKVLAFAADGVVARLIANAVRHLRRSGMSKDQAAAVPEIAAVTAAHADAVARLSAERSAKWWIDNRYTTVQTVEDALRTQAHAILSGIMGAK